MGQQHRIRDYALISDCHSAALIADGSVDWLCLPRFDSPSVFAAILDSERGGSFSIRPAGEYRASRGYDPSTNVLVTRFASSTGEVEITDCLAMCGTTADNAGQGSEARHALLRRVRCTAGYATLDVVCDPRPDYARALPRITGAGGRWILGQGAQQLILDSDAPLQAGEEPGLRARVDLSAGASLSFALHYSTGGQGKVVPPHLDAGTGIEDTRAYWRAWSGRLRYSGRYEDAVVRSALLLKALTYAPTGAIVAAPTTSLPEWIGAGRNWDYRYCWLRDSTFTLYALEHLACTDDAVEYRHWLEHASAKGPASLRIAYTLDGQEVPPEQTLDHLRGFDGSQPVRIGNDARAQVQLDVYGELMDTAFFASGHGAAADDAYWGFLSSLAEYVCDHWREPDRGIWEMRIEPQQFVYSKVLCWVCLNRATRLARRLGKRPPAQWRREMEAIRAEVLEQGYNASVGAFVQWYGSTHLDAANLILPVVGFIDARDPRMASTIRLTEERLAIDGLVRRYQGIDDGLEGGEGAFLLCSFWLVDALILLGERRRARALFERLLTYRNDVGLLAEEYDPAGNQALGNFPQAFSHLALITSALNLRYGGVDRRHHARRKA
jgi:GH15 family glucan-1,4-alpha-glucosidase